MAEAGFVQGTSMSSRVITEPGQGLGQAIDCTWVDARSWISIAHVTVTLSRMVLCSSNASPL